MLGNNNGKANLILKIIIGLITGAVLFIAIFDKEAKADDGLLDNSTWELLFTENMTTTNSLIQSICVTDYYIITIENVADSADTADVVRAYYKLNVDENGNPVTQYALAKQVQEEEWEHGNGMCYNPNTNEIYVSLYTNTIEENRGCLYVMDPSTLMKKGRIKVTDSFNILAIAYDNENNQYYIQTNAEANFSIMVLDSNFQIIKDLGPESTSPGYNYQDFCLVKDYFLQFPLTWGLGIGQYMSAYSISTASIVDTIQLFFNETAADDKIEPESIGQLDGNGFLVAVNGTDNSGNKACMFYRVEFPNLGLLPDENSPQKAPDVSMVSSVSVTSQSDTSGETVDSSVSVEKDTQALAAKKAEDGKNGAPVALIIVIIILGAGAVFFFLYLKRVQRERARREARMRKARRIMLANMAKDENDEETFDIHELDELKKD